MQLKELKRQRSVCRTGLQQYSSKVSPPFRYYKTDIKGAPSGKLHGKRVVIKDNVAVAGVPMMNGTKLLEGYIPEYDATIVTRILDAGIRTWFDLPVLLLDYSVSDMDDEDDDREDDDDGA